MSLEIPSLGEGNQGADPKIKKAIEVLNGLLDGSNKIPGSSLASAAGITAGQLAAAAKPVTWYTPKIIATEQSRESTSFGKLGTADEIPEVVVPENGFIDLTYRAKVKSSVSLAGRMAVFLGANQLKSVKGAALEVGVTSAWKQFWTEGTGFEGEESETADATTGQLAVKVPFRIFAAAGTYNVSVQFKATSGSITAKERKLWAEVHGG